MQSNFGVAITYQPKKARETKDVPVSGGNTEPAKDKKEEEKDKKPKKNRNTQDTKLPEKLAIGKPKETLIQFALSAQRLVTPRMNVEKDIGNQPDLIPTDSEMLLSIAKLVTKLNLCSLDMSDDNVLACDYMYTTLVLGTHLSVKNKRNPAETHLAKVQALPALPIRVVN